MPGNSFAILIFILVGVLAIAGITYAALAAKRRREMLTAWAQQHGLTFSPARRYEFDNLFPAFSCLRTGDGRYAHNVCEGPWNGRGLLAFDYHYETHSTDSKGHSQTHHHHFSAAIIGNPFPLEPLHIRPENFFDKITEFFGADDIDFESAEFSRKFFVKAPDRKWAYDVLHARAMEFLLAQPRFTIQFDAGRAISHRSSVFSTTDFEQALGAVCGLLDMLPEYVVQQQRDRAGLAGSVR